MARPPTTCRMPAAGHSVTAGVEVSEHPPPGAWLPSRLALGHVRVGCSQGEAAAPNARSEGAAHRALSHPDTGLRALGPLCPSVLCHTPLLQTRKQGPEGKLHGQG